MGGTARKHDCVQWAWRVLGLDTNPSYDSIRAAYCRLAVATHPDRCTDPGAKEKFQLLHTAYETALENHSQHKCTKGRVKNAERSGFDWRSEVARVREAYSSMFKYRRRPEAAEAPSKKHSSTLSRAAPQQTKKFRRSKKKNAARAQMCGTNSAAAATGIASIPPVAQEERRLRVIEPRRRHYLSLSQKLVCRMVSREASRRRVIVHSAQKERRGILLCLNEERIRHAIKEWETVSWAKMKEQWAEL
ncbi:chaperone DnaJ protein [Trypanosoma rangeli]|uniref:Chaperone DnaJ protein n=1 Tax=Trypanosoma rangeli TaxID=5698 RepID=A0A3R7NNA5_TRYRA|nr:chaperone DnaJ protein [Trypanosoma rangeli]RNF08949.1 chaperone DnaJ protein [Trypanosoma rangeli]|eukprot:RNF08949.1 chaperone DnaJ protein [Trypanosoma rangeli]